MGDRPNYPIPVNPKYDPNIPIILDEDFVIASTTTNPINERLIENTHFLKQQISILKAKIEALTGFSISGSVNNYRDLPDPGSLPIGTLFVVRDDENHQGRTAIYETTATGWLFVAYLKIDLSHIEADITKLFNYVDTLNSLIDVAISTRAPAITALSTVYWTNIRAALIDSIGAMNVAIATAVNNTTTLMGYAKGIFQHLLTNLSAARTALIDSIGAMNAANATAVNNTTTLIGYVKGIFQHLLTNLSATRMANLDVAISSRAPANTALNTSRWTDALAANLAALASGGTATVGVTVQRGIATLSGAAGSTVNVTISPVDLTRSFELSGFSIAEANNSPLVSIRLTSMTNLAVQQIGNSGGISRNFPWAVVTYT